MVAAELGNTPSICRDYYVHPAVFSAIDQQRVANPNPFKDARSAYGLSASEKLAKRIIEESHWPFCENLDP